MVTATPDLWAQLGLWVAIWTAVGAGFVLLVRRGHDYVRGWKVATPYFALASVLVFLVFRETLAPRLTLLGGRHLLGLAAVFLAGLAAHRIAHRRGRPPERRIRQSPHVYWLRMDPRYAVSKSVELLFQQTMLVALVFTLAGGGLSRVAIVSFAMFVFGIVHLPIARLVGRYFGIYYFVSSLLAAVVFPLVILARPDGFVLSYLLHVLYYAGSQLFFWDWSAPTVTRGASPPPAP